MLIAICSVIIGIIGLLAGMMLGGMISSSPSIDIPCAWDLDKSVKLSNLEMKVFTLERENERLNYIFRSHEMKKRYFEEEYYAHCNYCAKKFYSKTPKSQEIADLLKKNVLNVEELAKKLDIEIN